MPFNQALVTRVRAAGGTGWLYSAYRGRNATRRYASNLSWLDHPGSPNMGDQSHPANHLFLCVP